MCPPKFLRILSQNLPGHAPHLSSILGLTPRPFPSFGFTGTGVNVREISGTMNLQRRLTPLDSSFPRHNTTCSLHMGLRVRQEYCSPVTSHWNWWPEEAYSRCDHGHYSCRYALQNTPRAWILTGRCLYYQDFSVCGVLKQVKPSRV
jgi:hypothetical protein